MEDNVKIINVSVISPEKVLYQGPGQTVALPGKEGNFTVLPGHVNLVSVLSPGLLTIQDGDKTIEFIIDGGFAEVSPGKVSALVEGTIDLTDIDIEKEQESLNELLKQVISPEVRSKIENKLETHRFRINLAGKK